MISPSSVSNPTLNAVTRQGEYTPIPHFPGCLGGEWKNLVKTPYLKTTMRFKAGTSLPPHHFPTMSRITILSGSIQIDDLQTSQAYILSAGEDCIIPALLVHEVKFLEDIEFDFELNSKEMYIFWDLEER